jgi:hypothetical protein
LNKRLVKVTMDKGIAEKGLKKEIDVLSKKVEYQVKESERLRNIVEEREDEIKLLLQSDQNFDKIRNHIHELR